MSARYIVCAQCRPRYKLCREDAGAGYHLSVVEGKVKATPPDHGVTMTVNGISRFTPFKDILCDLCGRVMAQGTQGFAISLWRGEPDDMTFANRFLQP